MSVQTQRAAELNPELYVRQWAPKRVAWSAPQHPAPEVPGRLAVQAELPKTAARLVLVAVERGWRVRATYARGTSTDSQGNATKVVESVAVRGFKNGLAFLAFWADGKFSSAWIWGVTGLQPVKSQALVKLVAAWA